jgi:hypothetical protein
MSIDERQQIAFRIAPEICARLSDIAKRDKISVAALSKRLVEWALPHCEEFGSIFPLEQPELRQYVQSAR